MVVVVKEVVVVVVAATVVVVVKEVVVVVVAATVINQLEFRLCVEVGDHGAPFASVKCLHTALRHTHFRHLAHVASPTLSSSSSASFSIHLALQH